MDVHQKMVVLHPIFSDFLDFVSSRSSNIISGHVCLRQKWYNNYAAREFLYGYGRVSWNILLQCPGLVAFFGNWLCKGLSKNSKYMADQYENGSEPK